MAHSTLVILAAGEQLRWAGSKPKGLSLVHGETLIDQLIRRFDPTEARVVVLPNRAQEFADQLTDTRAVCVFPEGPTIADSLAAGLRGASGSDVTIVSADTWLGPGFRVSAESLDGTWFDPWAWVTIQRCASVREISIESDVLPFGTRMEMADSWTGRTYLHRLGAVNVNTLADLETVRALHPVEA